MAVRRLTQRHEYRFELQGVAARRRAGVFRIADRIGNDRVGFDFDIDVGAFLQFNLAALVVHQPVRHANLAIEMVRTFYDDLRLFWFPLRG